MDEFVEHLTHRRRVAVHDGGGCCDVAVGVEVLPVEDEASVAGELLEEGTLRSAVALAERMDGVDLTEVVGRPLGERVPRKTSQKASPCSDWKMSAAADSMYCGRQNQVPFAMATVLSCPAQSSMSPKILRWIARRCPRS